jgi:hypothetical protein
MSTGRDVHGAGNMTLVPLVLFSNIDDNGLACIDQLARTGCVDLGNLGAHLLQQSPVRRHRFPKYSDACLGYRRR